MRSILFGAAVSTAACTFTACDMEGEEAVAPQATMQARSVDNAVIPGKYIVVFKQDGVRLSASATYAQRVDAAREIGQELLADNGAAGAAIEQAYGKAIVGVAVRLSGSQAERLRQDARVAYVEQDRIITLGKPTFGGGTTAPQETPWGVARVGYASGAGKTAWIIDTGIDLDHPDLKVDLSRSKTFVSTGKDAKSADDGNGHGTHVAGTVAAVNNDKGVIGVAYDATVVAVKVLNSQGSGSYSDVIAGIDYVAANGETGDVANMSLGGPVSQALDEAVLSAAGNGIRFALAAGNDGADANNTSPARVNHANVYTVSAMDSKDGFASFSNYGNPPIEYAAPGVGVKSTWKGGGYNTISGTSMAAPHVAGLLLVGITSDGTVLNDPDGNPDPIAHIAQ